MLNEEHSLIDMQLFMTKILIKIISPCHLLITELQENSLSEILIYLKWLFLDLNMDILSLTQIL